MQQVRATFKDRKTAVARMSFFTPMNPILQRELGSIRYDRPNRAAIYPGPMFDYDFKEFEDPEAEKQSPWRNGRFRVLVGTHCACLYCVTFWGYSVFPMLISEQGPSLELISFLYSLEGAAQVICTILVMPFLDSQIFLKYFSTAFLLLFSAPLAVCLLGKIHWFFYLLTLLLVDVLLCVCNALLGVVVLRSLPWDQILVFYNIACTLGGVLSGTSFVQMPLKALVGSWELASVIGHGVPLLLLLLFYLMHLPALKELWELLLQPVRRTNHGEWDPEDLEEEEEDEQAEEPPSLLTDESNKGCRDGCLE